MVERPILARLTAVASLAFVLGATPARAGLVAYTDPAAFKQVATGLTPLVIPDPAPASFQFLGSGTASVTYGSYTFSTSASLSNGNFFNVGMGYSGDPAVVQSSEQTTGVANILITLPTSTNIFALSYATFHGTDVVFTLSNGDQITEPSTAGGYATTSFLGLTDTTAFTSVLVTSADPTGLNINNIDIIPSVPEPGSLALCGIAGAVALGVVARRSKGTTSRAR